MEVDWSMNTYNFNDILSNPLWLPDSISNDNIEFKLLSEESFKFSPFLDNPFFEESNICNIPFENITNQNKIPDLSIFHMSHVGSTLISKIVETSNYCILKEPPLPKKLALWDFDCDVGVDFKPIPSINEMSKVVQDLHARSLNGRRMGVKYTSDVNRIGHLFLDKIRGEKIYVMTSLKNFLCYALSSEGVVEDMYLSLPIHFFDVKNFINVKKDMNELTFLDIICIVWASHMDKLLRLQNRFGGLLVNFDSEMVSNTMLQTLSKYLNLQFNENDISEVMNTYSKTRSTSDRQSFSYLNRKNVLDNMWNKEKESLQPALEEYYNIFNESSVLHPISDYVF